MHLIRVLFFNINRRQLKAPTYLTHIAALHNGSSAVLGLNAWNAGHESVTLTTTRIPRPRVKRQILRDEAHFWLNGYVNKQNCRIWSEANPQVYVETPLHPEKLTVWCTLWAGGILLQKR
ncbi:hypothetical protein TNCV_2469731 [Trichonephila clavipes]|nr:hypothetical protein TNCV_2469731 [Trichonephila clavipes]